MNDFYNDFNHLAPKCFGYWENQTKSNKMSEILKQKLLPAADFNKNSSEGMGVTISDGFIGYPIYKFVESVSSFTNVYFYNTPG